MEVGNITKGATFKCFLHVSYKTILLLFLWRCFGGYTKIWIARFNLLSRNIPKFFWRIVCGTTFLLKNKGGSLVVCTLQEKYIHYCNFVETHCINPCLRVWIVVHVRSRWIQNICWFYMLKEFYETSTSSCFLAYSSISIKLS